MSISRPVLAAVLLFSVFAFSQQPPADSPASREQILKMFEVMHIRQQMRPMMEGMFKQQSELVRETMKQRYPQMTDQEMERTNNAMIESVKDFPFDDMLADMIPVYQKHLTQADAEAMIAFYSSPTGQKLMQELPAITSEGMQAAYPRMQKHMEKVMQGVEQQMNKTSAPKKDSAPKSTPPNNHHDDSTT
jgi:uncharacterized protein